MDRIQDKKPPQHDLKRSISLFQAIMYGIGLILGAGIYVIIGDVAGIAGNAMWISFIAAAFIALLLLIHPVQMAFEAILLFDLALVRNPSKSLLHKQKQILFSDVD
jgi:L-asparagine transporter-like permease